MKKVSDEWERFKSACIPDDAPEIQRVEMKKAFYAGCSAMFGLLVAITDETNTEVEGAQRADILQNEIKEFAFEQSNILREQLAVQLKATGNNSTLN